LKPVLLIAEAANPDWSSVPLVGWSLSTAIARRVPAHIVTQVRNRAAFLGRGLVEGRDFTAIDNERVAGPAHRLASLLGGGRGKGWTTTMALNYVAYPSFERGIWHRFGGALAAGEYRLVHRVTPLSPTIPSSIARKCHRIGVPFLLGPLNGGLPWPKGYKSVAVKEREFLSFVRNAYKLLPGRAATLRCAARILVGSRATEAQVPARYRDKCVYLPENGLDPQRFSARRQHRAQLPLRAIFVGRLVPYKGPDVVIEAVAPFLARGEVQLSIVGDGPMREELTRQAEAAGVAGGVRFTGWVAHHEVQQLLAAADVFLFPSIREFGGATPLEAMAVGLPPLVVDYGGPGEIVTDAAGWKIPIGPRAQLVESVRSAVAAMVRDPSSIDARASAALAVAWPRFDWDDKARRIAELYDEVVGCPP
jgi:glycosyltransferase involved in cell wall biosynthesis